MLSEIGTAALLCAPFVTSTATANRPDDWRDASRYDLFMNMAAAGAGLYGELGSMKISLANIQSLAMVHAFEATNSRGWTLVCDTPEAPSLSPQEIIREVKRLSGLTWDNIAEIIGVSTRSVHLWLSGGQMAETKQQKVGSILSVLKYIDRGYGKVNRALILSASDEGTTVLTMLATGEYERAKATMGAGSLRSSPFPSLPVRARARTAPDHFGHMLEAYGADEIEDVEPVIPQGKRRVVARRKGA